MRSDRGKKREMKKGNHMLFWFVSVWLFMLMIPVFHAHATSVRQVTINEMLEKAQFVFEGRVTALESRESSRKRIHTYITFEITDIIKGEYGSNFITLRFLGGRVGDVTLVVSDMRLPQVGEHGIYFVESLNRMQVNPLYGWSQGHFIVERDAAGIGRVMTNRRQPVKGVKQEASEGEAVEALSQGVSRDLVVSKDSGDNGLTVDEFKRILYKKMGKKQ